MARATMKRASSGSGQLVRHPHERLAQHFNVSVGGGALRRHDQRARIIVPATNTNSFRKQLSQEPLNDEEGYSINRPQPVAPLADQLRRRVMACQMNGASEASVVKHSVLPVTAMTQARSGPSALTRCAPSRTRDPVVILRARLLSHVQEPAGRRIEWSREACRSAGIVPQHFTREKARCSFSRSAGKRQAKERRQAIRLQNVKECCDHSSTKKTTPHHRRLRAAWPKRARLQNGGKHPSALQGGCGKPTGRND